MFCLVGIWVKGRISRWDGTERVSRVWLQREPGDGPRGEEVVFEGAEEDNTEDI